MQQNGSAFRPNNPQQRVAPNGMQQQQQPSHPGMIRPMMPNQPNIPQSQLRPQPNRPYPSQPGPNMVALPQQHQQFQQPRPGAPIQAQPPNVMRQAPPQTYQQQSAPMMQSRPGVGIQPAPPPNGVPQNQPQQRMLRPPTRQMRQSSTLSQLSQSSALSQSSSLSQHQISQPQMRPSPYSQSAMRLQPPGQIPPLTDQMNRISLQSSKPQTSVPQPNGYTPQYARPMPQSHQSQQQQQPSAPGGYNPQMKQPLRPTGMRPNPAVAPSRPIPTGFAAAPSQKPTGYDNTQQKSFPGAMPPPQQQPQQQQERLPSAMMPRPCALEAPTGTPRMYYHRGLAQGPPDAPFPTIPASNSDYISVDDGSTRLRFMRMTTNAVASDPNVMTKSGIPLAVVMQPFANTKPGEPPVPVIDFSAVQVGGPLRCERCNAYSNPGFKFLSGGSKFQCNLCTHVNTTPEEHTSPISPATGHRMDADSRHELRMGSVDYVVGSPDYCVRPPKPACFLFAVDVSTSAIQSGLSFSAMMSMKSALSAGLLPGGSEGARMAIMTFDKNLHFFDGRGSEKGKSVSMQLVTDIMDPFVPLGGNALFLTPAQAIHAIDAAVEIHNLNPKSKQAQNDGAPPASHPESALGSALLTIKQAFADCGGKAFVVVGSIPTAGVSRLERRGGGAIGGGEDREMGLLKQATSEYDILGCELAEVQASVDLFLAPSSVYIDAATLSRVPRASGGRMHLFTSYDTVRDGASLHRSLCASVSEPRAFEALLRVRTSPGLEARGEFLGHFGRPQRGDDVAGPVFDSSSCLSLELVVSSKLSDEDKNRGGNRGYPGGVSLYDDACVQCAVLFTDCAGRRRIRVHTLFLTKTSVLSDVFKHADVDATATFLAKKASSAVLIGGTPFTKACDAVTEKTAQTFFVYRKHCTQAPSSGQLILPEALKVLPVMMLGLTKSAAFRRSAISVQSGEAVTVDERAAALSFLISATPGETAAMCYPRMWNLSTLAAEAGVPLPPPTTPIVGYGEGGKSGKEMEPLAIPNSVPLSSGSLNEQAILLLENGMQMVLWIGSEADKSIANSIVADLGGGRLCIRGETAGSVALTKDINEYGKRVARIVGRVVNERKGLSRPCVVVRTKPGAGGEAKFVIPLMIEDHGADSLSYTEYLRQIHKRVMEKMATDSAQSDMQTWEILNYGY